MIEFKERLRAELVEFVEERRPEPAPRRRRRRWAWRVAVPVGVTAAVVAAALVSGTHRPEPPVATPMVIDEVGFSIEVKPDGIVEITLDDPAGAKALERRLNELGFRAVVLVSTADCAEAAPPMVVPANEFIAGIGARGGLEIRPSVLPADAYLLIVYRDAEDQYPNDGPGMTMIGAVRTPPSCYRWVPPTLPASPR